MSQKGQTYFKKNHSLIYSFSFPFFLELTELVYLKQSYAENVKKEEKLKILCIGH